MADITQEVGTQFEFNVTGSFSPADAATDFGIGSPTNVVLTLSGVADDAGRQSDKFDFGANRSKEYECIIAVDFTGETPVADSRVDVYFAPSHSTTQANANVAGNSGADGVCPAGALGSITLDEFLAQCQFIGSLAIHDGASVQVGPAGSLAPKSRYGQIIVVNRSGDAFEADNVEACVWLTGVTDDVA